MQNPALEPLVAIGAELLSDQRHAIALGGAHVAHNVSPLAGMGCEQLRDDADDRGAGSREHLHHVADVQGEGHRPTLSTNLVRFGVGFGVLHCGVEDIKLVLGVAQVLVKAADVAAQVVVHCAQDGGAEGCCFFLVHVVSPSDCALTIARDAQQPRRAKRSNREAAVGGAKSSGGCRWRSQKQRRVE